jgi:ABC-type tungstate transport system permease subunit
MESMHAVLSAKSLLVVFAVLALVGCRAPSINYRDVATTTSIYNSGLRETLLPQSATVRVHPVVAWR